MKQKTHLTQKVVIRYKEPKIIKRNASSDKLDYNYMCDDYKNFN